MHRRWLDRMVFSMLLLAILVPARAIDARASAPPERYAGWAVEAYPELAAHEMEDLVWRLASAGANVIWIGHNNPGEVEAGKLEPGLSYAVYEAYQDESDPRHHAAREVVLAQHRMLAACRAAEVKAVLPVGYQIQMGRKWNGEHPDDLRRDRDGQLLDIHGGGVSASFHAPAFRQAMEGYYSWVDTEFARPYADVILMLNLADEPIGGDYSFHAEKAFQEQSGFGFDDVGANPERQRQLGEFQSRYVVQYAIESSNMWHSIHPGLPVTMSFDGGQARKAFAMPDVEALFRDTPSNFVVTFDAYPRDDLPHLGADEYSLTGLFLLARSLGLYSAQYGKSLWLWAAANSWGLSQESDDPGTVSDAVANGLYLTLLVRQAGGDLQGVAYWNYNVKEQGLYNDTHATAYLPDTMFAQVSEVLPELRRTMRGPTESPDVLILAPPARAHQEIGSAAQSIIPEGQPIERLAILAKEGVRSAIVSELSGWQLDELRAIVVLSPDPELLTQEDMVLLRGVLTAGTPVVTSPDVAAALAENAGASGEPVFDGLMEKRENLCIAQKGIAVLFEDRRHDLLGDFWGVLLGIQSPQPGYRVVTDSSALYYHLGPEPATVHLVLPYEASGFRFDDQARPVDRVRGPSLTVTLRPHEFMVLHRVWRRKPTKV
ncbi:hypothetical protein ACFLT5_02510 [Chloroflexota bacterium]